MRRDIRSMCVCVCLSLSLPPSHLQSSRIQCVASHCHSCLSESCLCVCVCVSLSLSHLQSSRIQCVVSHCHSCLSEGRTRALFCSDEIAFCLRAALTHRD